MAVVSCFQATWSVIVGKETRKPADDTIVALGIILLTVVSQEKDSEMKPELVKFSK
jgi:hypothetical protein